jgi:hypothetical protein
MVRHEARDRYHWVLFFGAKGIALWWNSTEENLSEAAAGLTGTGKATGMTSSGMTNMPDSSQSGKQRKLRLKRGF